jgi:hypothetical protein
MLWVSVFDAERGEVKTDDEAESEKKLLCPQYRPDQKANGACRK